MTRLKMIKTTSKNKKKLVKLSKRSPSGENSTPVFTIKTEITSKDHLNKPQIKLESLKKPLMTTFFKSEAAKNTDSTSMKKSTPKLDNFELSLEIKKRKKQAESDLLLDLNFHI